MNKIVPLVAASLMLSSFALADNSSDSPWLVRFRVIDINPDVSSDVTGLAADIEVDNKITPELDFTYFFTDEWAAELILATAKHDVSTDTGVDLGSVGVLPPQLTFQYHFNPAEQVRPYAGAGLGYILYYDAESGDVNDIEYDDGFTYTVQLGLDYGIDEKWAVNVDVKKIFHETTAEVNGGAITADVDLDPWVVGIGLAYKL